MAGITNIPRPPHAPARLRLDARDGAPHDEAVPAHTAVPGRADALDLHISEAFWGAACVSEGKGARGELEGRGDAA